MLLLVLSLACGAGAADTASAAADTGADACTLLTYDNFGEAFIRNWCMNCHAASTEGDARYGAPSGVDFDTHDDVVAWADRIAARADVDTPTMPPAGGADASERARLAEWLACGAP